MGDVARVSIGPKLSTDSLIMVKIHPKVGSLSVPTKTLWRLSRQSLRFLLLDHLSLSYYHIIEIIEMMDNKNFIFYKAPIDPYYHIISVV
jgi:hypothetical protein